MKLNKATIAYIILGLAAALILTLLITYLRSRRSKGSYEERWKENQKLLAQKKEWKEAVINADQMLDEVLKKRKFKGKTMGERLVAAQHEITSNDMVWFSHKLKNKILYEGLELTKTDVKKAMLGFWQALRDLGAFNKEKDE